MTRVPNSISLPHADADLDMLPKTSTQIYYHICVWQAKVDKMWYLVILLIHLFILLIRLLILLIHLVISLIRGISNILDKLS